MNYFSSSATPSSRLSRWGSAAALLLVAAAGLTAAQASPTLARGADIGWLNQLENRGVTWQSPQGQVDDPVAILARDGVNAVRLRVFVDPPSDFIFYNRDKDETSLLGYADARGVLYMAQRAKAQGLRIMVDFHYSDHWADPGTQDKPAAWAEDSVAQLAQDVYDHTHRVMTKLADAGIHPAWVQVGNEITQGMLWPEGKTPNFDNLARFINAGYRAVKDVSPDSEVIVHLDSGTDNDLYRYYFDALTQAGAQFDVIGMSYYPYWDHTDYTQNITQLRKNLNDMALRYGKKVMVCEVGGQQSMPDKTFNMLRAVQNAVKAVPDDKGLGLFYWEPEANSAVLPDGYPLGATQLISDQTLRFTRAISAFKPVNLDLSDRQQRYEIVNRHSGRSLNVVDGAVDNGAAIEQWLYNGWRSQQWQLVPVNDTQYEIMNSASGKVLNVAGGSNANGAPLEQYADNGWASQRWTFTAQGSGYYRIQSVQSDDVMDVSGAVIDNGAAVVQSPDDGTRDQQWRLIPLN